MSAKKFNTPFAILGDKVEVPTTAQIDGSVSFEQGYPFGYEADYTDPNSKDISRSKTNQLLFDITNAIREIQQGGVSEWSEDGKPYKINSLVYAPDGTIKQSLIANNNNDTTHSSWSNLVNKKYVDENAKLNINSFPEKVTPVNTDNLALQETGGLLKKLSFANLKLWILSLFNPSMTGTVSFSSTTNNIQLTNIVTSLGLEIGDVIQISGAEDAKNNSEFTVEVITDNNNIIVNQAHANKGTTKNVANRSGDTGVTVKLLAKWYNAPIGLGRSELAFPLAVDTTRQNLTNRPLLVTLYSTTGTGVVRLQNITTGTVAYATITAGIITASTILVGIGEVYKWIVINGTPVVTISEVR